MAKANPHIQTTLVPGNKYCIQVANLSPKVSGEELSNMFGIAIEYILIDTAKNEAWIKNIFRKDTADTMAESHNGKFIHNQPITCRPMMELIHIFKLCSHNRNGQCKFGFKCGKKHVPCENADTCANSNCYYGHSSKRPPTAVAPIDYKDQAIELYRIKITGLPMGTTSEILTKTMGKKAIGLYKVPQDQTSTTAATGAIGYLTGQTSESMAQRTIQQWRQIEFFPGCTLKYQLEIDSNIINIFPDDKSDPYDSEPTPQIYNSGSIPTQDDHKPEKSPVPVGGFHSDDEDDIEKPLEWPEDIKAKSEWKYTGKILGATDTGQGEVFLIRRISGTREKAALKIYKRMNEKTKRMRSYREMVALRAMVKENNVISNVSVLIETNIEADFHKVMNDKKPLWIILKLAHGCSLREFVEKIQIVIKLREAIGFCIELLKITKSFHACGIVHRDLKPDNIHIECSDESSLDEGNTTVLDFGLAYIEQDRMLDDSDLDAIENTQGKNTYATSTGAEIGNRWYRVRQLVPQSTAGLTDMQKNEIVQQRRNPSIDASSVCGILYWLLTKEVPGEEYAKKHEPPPHQKLIQAKPNIWNDVIQQAIIQGRSTCSETRLKRYLFDVFDRGFADASHQWSVDQLICHLTIMCNCLDQGTMSKTQLLHPISDIILSSRPYPFLDQFSPAAHIFEVAKNHFVEKFRSPSVIYHWTTRNKFRWIDELATYQRSNVDLLHYYDANGNMWTVEIYCLAKIDQEMNTNMFVGSIVNGINIQLPVYTLSSRKTSEILKKLNGVPKIDLLNDPNLQDPINEIFAEELHTLIREFHQKTTQ